MSDVLVSFIIPVYNTAEYLRQCLNSILVQTYTNIEIIIVDDGSTDRSPYICDEYAKKDSRIVAYHKKNGGLSDARNFGLNHAKGDYIVFLDSDDFWAKDSCLSELIKILNDSPCCEFVGFNMSYYFQESGIYKKWIAYDDTVSGDQTRDDKICWMVHSGTMPMSACSKIIKKSFLEREHIRFKEGIFSEDIPWFLEVLNKCENFKLVNEYIYVYRQGVKNSITSTFNTKKFQDLFDIVKNGLKYIEEASFGVVTKDALFSFMAYEYLILLAYQYRVSDAMMRNELKSYSWLLRYTANPKVHKAAIVYKLVGLRLTGLLMRLYMILR